MGLVSVTARFQRIALISSDIPVIVQVHLNVKLVLLYSESIPTAVYASKTRIGMMYDPFAINVFKAFIDMRIN